MNRKTVTIAALAVATIGVGAAAIAAPGQMRQAPVDMTRAQAADKAGEHFDRMDANKDGKLDAADRTARHAQMFERIDTDKNGAISRAEFDAHHARMSEQRGARGEGMRGHGDHRMGAKGEGKGWGGMGRDANGDGSVTRTEFVNARLARFDRADADKNGTVTVAEHRAAREAMKAQWQQTRAQRQAAPATN